MAVENTYDLFDAIAELSDMITEQFGNHEDTPEYITMAEKLSQIDDMAWDCLHTSPTDAKVLRDAENIPIYLNETVYYENEPYTVRVIGIDRTSYEEFLRIQSDKGVSKYPKPKDVLHHAKDTQEAIIQDVEELATKCARGEAGDAYTIELAFKRLLERQQILEKMK